MKTIVLGANGLMGTELRYALPKESSFFATRSDCDITDITSIRNYIDKLNISEPFVIINCAANRDAERMELSDYNNSERITVQGPHNLALIANEFGATLLHFSSDYVFDGNKNTPYTEEDKTNALNVYGKLKIISEQDLLNTANSVIILRPAWIFSAYGKDFVKTIVRLSQTNQELRVIFDQVGSPTYGSDLARYISEMLPNIKHGMKEIYHLSNEGVCSWYDIACSIKRHMNLNCSIIPVHSSEYKQNAQRPAYSVLDKGKVKRDFNLKIRHYEDALYDCCSKIKEH